MNPQPAVRSFETGEAFEMHFSDTLRTGRFLLQETEIVHRGSVSSAGETVSLFNYSADILEHRDCGRIQSRCRRQSVAG